MITIGILVCIFVAVTTLLEAGGLVGRDLARGLILAEGLVFPLAVTWIYAHILRRKKKKLNTAVPRLPNEPRTTESRCSDLETKGDH